MSTAAESAAEKLIHEHNCELVDDFLAHDLHAECSCGWVGPTAQSRDAAFASYLLHLSRYRTKEPA